MTTEKDYSTLFKAGLVAERRILDVTFRLYSNRIFYVVVPRFKKIGMDVIEAGYDFLDENGGGQFYNIYEFHSFSDVEPEIREWAADRKGNNYTLADAIVIGSLSQKIITDFYLRFNKPIRPTKIFYALDKAAEWVLNRSAEDNA